MGTDSDIISRLKELSGMMTAREMFHQVEDERASSEFEIDRVVPGETVRNNVGEFFLVISSYPLTEEHGNTSLLNAQQVDGEAIAVIAGDDELSEFRLDRALFLDTETTGLAGGSGTYAFLVGIGRFEGGNFVVRQYFMRDYDEEEAMLVPLADTFQDAEGVVTYNGKGFDFPVLQARFVTNRVRVRLEDVAHLDLLPVARRLWRMRLGDCSLVNIERAVLGVTRYGDIPSYLIPQVYFDYIRTRDARKLEAVFYHNRQDILSLAGVVSHAARLATAPPDLVEAHPLDLLSLARLHFRQGRYPVAERFASEAYDSGLDADVARTALYLLALSLKRQRRWEDAHRIWCQLARHYRQDIESRVEIAKHLEHRERDLTNARDICAESIEIALTYEGSAITVEELQYRLARIERKLRMNGFDVSPS